jgi:hypothetical protein
MQLTRRKLAAALLAPAAAAQAQTQPVAADEVAAARARLKANSEALAKIEVPMAVEPAVTFKA